LTQHPIFQTFVLPLLLALLAMAALRVWLGERWALCGAMVGLLGALAWFLGFEWPAVSRTQKLPWVVLAGLGLALLATARETGGARPLWAPLAAVAAWGGVGLWLADGQASLPLLIGAGLLGGVVLWRLAGGRAADPADPADATDGAGRPGPAERAGTAAMAAMAPGAAMTRWGRGGRGGRGAPGAKWAEWAALTAAALGLAALAATGGSLLLAQLAGMLASTAVAAAGWAWLRPAAPPAGATGGHQNWLARPAWPIWRTSRTWPTWPLGLTWMSIAWTWVLAAPAVSSTRALQVALLALIFLLPAALSRLRAKALTPRRRPFVVLVAVLVAVLTVVLLAALAVVLAGWAGTASMQMPDTPVDPNDPYLTP
jgi:hypothetical protein